MATKFIPPLTQTLFHGTRKLHSEISGKGPEAFIQTPHLVAGENFSALVWSSSPMPRNIQVIVDGEKATTPASFNEPATKADSTCPNTLSNASTKSTSSSQSSSNRDDSTETASAGPPLFVIFCVVGIILVHVFYQKGLERGARDLKDLVPEGKIFTEREGLLKKEEWLKKDAERIIFCPFCGKLDCEHNVRNGIVQNQRKALAERIETLDRKELQQLRQRTSVLEGKLARQKAWIETDRARESPVGILPYNTHTVDGRYSGTADLVFPVLSGSFVKVEEEEPLGCPSQNRGKADPPTKHTEGFPSAKVMPQVPSHGFEVNEAAGTVPHHDDSIAHPEPDRKPTGPPSTQTQPRPASDVTLESLSAEKDATNEEMGQIKRAKEALKRREKELEAQGKNRKKRMQELDSPKLNRSAATNKERGQIKRAEEAPKSRERELKTQGKDREKRIQELDSPRSDQILPIASGMLLGSALAFGVTMISVVRN